MMKRRPTETRPSRSKFAGSGPDNIIDVEKSEFLKSDIALVDSVCELSK